ncbi:hypothetical protein GW17_00042725, partial [Ensete ventricosum]
EERKRSYELQERRRWWQRGRRVVGKGIGVQKMDFVALPWKLLRWSTLHQQVPISSILSLNNGDSWTMPEAKDIIKTTGTGDNKMNLVTNDCNLRTVSVITRNKSLKMYSTKFQMHNKLYDKTISNLELELAAARAAQESILNGAPLFETLKRTTLRIFLAFILLDMILLLMLLILIFNLTALRYSNSATSGGILDKAIEAEHRKHGDFMRLDHIEGYLELSAKTKYANEDVSLGSWFIGVDVEHIDDRRLCCGTPPVVASCYMNVPLTYVRADCEWKAQAGNICVASFDWSCSGICNSAERIKEVHRRCGEGEKTLWNAVF